MDIHKRPMTSFFGPPKLKGVDPHLLRQRHQRYHPQAGSSALSPSIQPVVLPVGLKPALCVACSTCWFQPHVLHGARKSGLRCTACDMQDQSGVCSAYSTHSGWTPACWIQGHYILYHVPAPCGGSSAQGWLHCMHCAPWTGPTCCMQCTEPVQDAP